MPRFGEIGDTGAVNHSYADKIIVYVEAEDDARTFYGITGRSIREYLEFVEPRAAGTGAETVITQVRLDRPANPKVFGLVDGEVAAKFGAVEELIDSDDVLFQIDRPGLEGLVFLAQYEMENILLLYGDLPELMCRDVNFHEFGDLTAEGAEHLIAKAAQLFFLAALLKFASITLHRRAYQQGHPGCKTIDSGRFQGRGSVADVLGEIKREVADEGLTTWAALESEVRQSHRRLRLRLQTSGSDWAAVRRERLRLADGKAVLKRLKNDHSKHGRWHSHLLRSIQGTEFSEQFRQRLLAITGA